MVIPVHYKVIGGATVIVATGALLTLVHQSSTGLSHHDIKIEQSGSDLPTSAAGVLKNSPNVTVNGQQIPLKEGTTRVNTDNGTATVNVHGNSASVDQDSSQPASVNTENGSVNISVHSSSNSSDDNARSHSTTRVNSSSHTSVSGTERSTVNIQTNP